MKTIFILILSAFSFCSCYSQVDIRLTRSYYSSQGLSLYNSGKYLEAVVQYSKAIDLDPTSEDDYLKRGDVKMSLRDFRGAIADYSEAIKINPMKSFSYYSRSIAKGMILNSIGVIEDCTKAIEINPHAGLYYTQRGVAEIGVGQKEKGCMDFSKAGELGEAEAYSLIQKYCNPKFQ